MTDFQLAMVAIQLMQWVMGLGVWNTGIYIMVKCLNGWASVRYDC